MNKKHYISTSRCALCSIDFISIKNTVEFFDESGTLRCAHEDCFINKYGDDVINEG